MLLQNQNKVLATSTLSMGSSNCRAIDARQIFPNSEILKSINTYAVDSLLIFIDKAKATNISPILTASAVTTKQLFDEDSGEILKEFVVYRDKDAYDVPKLGYNPQVQIITEKRLNGSLGTTEREYIRIKLSAKCLEEHYLYGISYNTLDILVDKINSWGLFNITADALLDARVSDLDIKYDIAASEDATRLFVSSMYSACKSDYKSVCKKHNSKNNVGLEVGVRGNEKVGFLKWYNKTIELCSSKNVDFILNHLSYFANYRYADKQLFRCELTVKDKADAVRKGILNSNHQQFTLKSVLKLIRDNESKIRDIFALAVSDKFVPLNKEIEERNSSNNKKSKVSQAMKDNVFKSAIIAFKNGWDIDLFTANAIIMLGTTDVHKSKVIAEVVEEAYQYAKEVEDKLAMKQKGVETTKIDTLFDFVS